MTRLDENRAYSIIAEKAGTHVDKVNNLFIWGNHSATQYPDTFHATVNGKPLREVINDDAYLDGPFLEKV